MLLDVRQVGYLPAELTQLLDLPPGLVYADRQEALASRWGFVCRCSLCSAHPSDIRRSDRRREQIESLRSELHQGLSTPTNTLEGLGEAIATAKEVLALIEEEGSELDDLEEHQGRDTHLHAHAQSASTAGMATLQTEMFEIIGRTELARGGNRAEARQWALKQVRALGQMGFVLEGSHGHPSPGQSDALEDEAEAADAQDAEMLVSGWEMAMME